MDTDTIEKMLSQKVHNFSSELAQYFTYKSKLVEEKSDDEDEEESDDVETGSNDSKATESEKDSSEKKFELEKARKKSVIGPVKEKEQKEIEDFRVNFSKKCMQKIRVDTAIAKGIGNVVSKDTGPRLAELYHYPGFDESETNQLPETDMREILLKTLLSQPNLNMKKSYEIECRHFLLSQLSIDIATDLFWWFFLDKYSQREEVQHKLLERVSENYVRLLWQPPTSSKAFRYRNTFFSDYPDLLSQAMYCTFCHTFPASWRQYNDKFINRVTSHVFMWLTGCKCENDHHKKWNLSKLEPSDLKADFETSSTTDSNNNIEPPKSGGSLLEFPEEDCTIDAESRLSQAAVISSFSNYKDEGQPAGKGQRRRTRFAEPSPSLLDSSPRYPPSPNSKITKSSLKNATPTSATSAATSRKVQFDQSNKTTKTLSTNLPVKTQQKRTEYQSTLLNSKQVYDRYAFNVEGISPLLSSYIRRNIKYSQLPSNKTLIRRVELSAATAPNIENEKTSKQNQDTEKDQSEPELTYAQFVTKEFKRSRAVLKEIAEKDNLFNKEIMEMWRTTNAELRNSEEKLQILLTQNEQIKKLSNLLMLEIMTEPSQRTTAASKAIKDALDSIEVKKVGSFGTRTNSRVLSEAASSDKRSSGSAILATLIQENEEPVK